jgi:D-glycero-D-manno-heptose 1,7-bisphosphate phosphatase
MSRPAIFFDKDGTLIEDVPYNVDPARIVLAPHAREGVKALADAGYAIVVVSNQSGVARGMFEEAALDGVRERLEDLLGRRLDGFYCCPHHPDGVVRDLAKDCVCRKPMPGLLHRAAAELDLKLSTSWMIGDILNDVEAGRRAGTRTVLMDNGNETEWIDGALRRPDCRVADVGEAALAILCGARRAA